MRRDLDLSTLAVGDEVVIIASGNWRQSVGAPQTVTKIGRRDVVLSGGRRFNVNTNREVGPSSSYSYDYLARPTDDEVLAIKRQQDRQRAAGQVRSEFDKFWLNREHYTAGDLAALRDAIQSAEALLDPEPADA